MLNGSRYFIISPRGEVVRDGTFNFGVWDQKEIAQVLAAVVGAVSPGSRRFRSTSRSSTVCGSRLAPSSATWRFGAAHGFGKSPGGGARDQRAAPYARAQGAISMSRNEVMAATPSQPASSFATSATAASFQL